MVSTSNERIAKIAHAETIPRRAIPSVFFLIGVFLVMAAGEMRAKRQTHYLESKTDYVSWGSHPICNDDYKSTI